MKTLLALLLAIVAVPVFAANPTFQSFDTNDFTATASINLITANTSPANPLSLVTQQQLQGQTGATNGLTLAQVIAVIGTNAIIQNAGYGSNTTILSLGVTNKLSVTNGSYLNLWLQNGAFLRTNSAAPFDWEFHNTNGIITYGTNTVTKVTLDRSGNLTLPQSGGGTLTFQTAQISQSLVAGNGGLTVNAAGNDIRTLYLAAESGKTNIIFLNNLGQFVTNDLTTWIASLPGSSSTSTRLPPNALGVLTNNGSGFTNWSTSIPGTWIGAGTLPQTAADSTWPNKTNFLAYTNGVVTPFVAGLALVAAGIDGNGVLKVSVTNWPTDIPTNTMGGTAIDFSIPDATTNLAGALTLSSVSNLKLGYYNKKLIHVINTTGSEQTITLATGWGVGIADTFVVTNNTRVNLWAECQPGVFTNVFQKQIVTH